MDLTTQYCPTRRDIEEHCWNLSSRLFETTALLVRAIGVNRQLFLLTRSECQYTREELADSQRQLRAHRIVHGC